MQIELIKAPTKEDFYWMKECAIGTMGKEVKTEPNSEWIHKMLNARHSPCRELIFKFVLRDIPYFVSVHLTRHHEGVNWYVQSQRNDRQSNYDRNQAPQNAPVTVRCSMNVEALMNIANKRLCKQASIETQNIVKAMCLLAEQQVPELKGLLVPHCQYYGKCHEIYPCGIKKESEVQPQGVDLNDGQGINEETANNAH